MSTEMTTEMEAVCNIGRSLTELPEDNVAFNRFCDTIVSIMERNLQPVGRCRSAASKREQLWHEFHKQPIEIFLIHGRSCTLL